MRILTIIIALLCSFYIPLQAQTFEYGYIQASQEGYETQKGSFRTTIEFFDKGSNQFLEIKSQEFKLVYKITYLKEKENIEVGRYLHLKLVNASTYSSAEMIIIKKNLKTVLIEDGVEILFAI